jgi:hypothetical protein
MISIDIVVGAATGRKVSPDLWGIAGQAHEVERVHHRDRVGQFPAGGGLETGAVLPVMDRYD